jgi:hypothetical protein
MAALGDQEDRPAHANDSWRRHARSLDERTWFVACYVERMTNGLAILGLLPLLIACGGKTEHSRELTGFSEDAGDTSGISTPPRAVAGSRDGSLPRCAAEFDTRPDERLSRTFPFLGSFSGTTAGTVRQVTAKGLDVDSVAGITHFGWAGPPLAEFFSPNEAVHLGST